MGVAMKEGGCVGMRDESGQMTVELAVAFPALLVVAVVAANGVLFLSDCAAFDRMACEAIRVYATAPGYGSGSGQACAQVAQALEARFGRSNLAFDVACENVGFDYLRFTATLRFSPTLFGMGLRSEVFGVALPQLTHRVTYTVDSYKPGVFI